MLCRGAPGCRAQGVARRAVPIPSVASPERRFASPAAAREATVVDCAELESARECSFDCGGLCRSACRMVSGGGNYGGSSRSG